MGNPIGFVELVTNDLLGRVLGNFQIKKYTINYVDEAGNLTHNDTEYAFMEEQKLV